MSPLPRAYVLIVCIDCGKQSMEISGRKICIDCVIAARALTGARRSRARVHTVQCVDCGALVDTASLLTLVCDGCRKTREAERRRIRAAQRATEDPFGHRDYHWRRTYGVSGNQVREMYEAQGGRCPICTLAIPLDDLAVDHCHATGVVGGVLHGLCNRGLGYFGDDPSNCDRAARYLRSVRPACAPQVRTGPTKG